LNRRGNRKDDDQEQFQAFMWAAEDTMPSLKVPELQPWGHNHMRSLFNFTILHTELFATHTPGKGRNLEQKWLDAFQLA
jgi:hypothetical protein